DNMDLDVDVFEMLQIARDGVAFDGEEADLGLHGKTVRYDAGTEFLIVPDDLIEVERNLLLGFEANDVADLLFLDRRQLDEPCQAALAGNADRDSVAAQRVARQELLQRLTD